MLQKPKQIILILLLVNLVQASLTGVLFDEAYYWRLGQDLDWGYFDHPPMIALITRLSSVFPMHLEARFFSVICYVAGMLIIERLISIENKIKFSIVLLGLLPLQFSIIAAPDAPLFLFACLTLYLMINWKDSLFHKILLFATFSLIMYSKYQGAILIIAIVLSNLSWLKKPWFYVGTTFSLLLFFPHLNWLYKNDWVTLKYHFIERSPKGFEWINIPSFIGGQIVFLFPAGVYLWIKGILTKEGYRLQRMILIFTISVLGYMMFKGKVEANWSLIVIPVCLTMVPILNEKEVKVFKRMLWVLIPIYFLLRVTFIFPESFKSNRFYRQLNYDKKWSDIIKEEAKDLPVTFFGAFQQASMYDYYSKGRSRTYSGVNTRKTQYDLWQKNDSILTNSMLILNWEGKSANKLISNQGEIFYLKDSIYYLNRFKLDLSQVGDSLRIDLKSYIPENLKSKLRLEFMVFLGKDLKHKEFIDSEQLISFFKSGSLTLPIDSKFVSKGDIIRVGFKYSWIPASNSHTLFRVF